MEIKNLKKFFLTKKNSEILIIAGKKSYNKISGEKLLRKNLSKDTIDCDNSDISNCKRTRETPFNELTSKSFLRTRLPSPPKFFSEFVFTSYM